MYGVRGCRRSGGSGGVVVVYIQYSYVHTLHLYVHSHIQTYLHTGISAPSRREKSRKTRIQKARSRLFDTIRGVKIVCSLLEWTVSFVDGVGRKDDWKVKWLDGERGLVGESCRNTHVFGRNCCTCVNYVLANQRTIMHVCVYNHGECVHSAQRIGVTTAIVSISILVISLC